MQLFDSKGDSWQRHKHQLLVRIPIQWAEAGGTLTVGKRQGGFPEMPKERTIQVVLCSKDKPAGFRFEAAPAKSAHYTGEAVVLKLR